MQHLPLQVVVHGLHGHPDRIRDSPLAHPLRAHLLHQRSPDLPLLLRVQVPTVHVQGFEQDACRRPAAARGPVAAELLDVLLAVAGVAELLR